MDASRCTLQRLWVSRRLQSVGFMNRSTPRSCGHLEMDVCSRSTPPHGQYHPRKSRAVVDEWGLGTPRLPFTTPCFPWPSEQRPRTL